MRPRNPRMDALIKAIHTSPRFSFEGAVSALRDTMPKIYEMNDTERKSVDEFLTRKDVKKVLGDGEFALVFSRQSGIGVSVVASVKNRDGTIISENVTDYSAW